MFWNFKLRNKMLGNIHKNNRHPFPTISFILWSNIFKCFTIVDRKILEFCLSTDWKGNKYIGVIGKRGNENNYYSVLLLGVDDGDGGIHFSSNTFLPVQLIITILIWLWNCIFSYITLFFVIISSRKFSSIHFRGKQMSRFDTIKQLREK